MKRIHETNMKNTQFYHLSHQFTICLIYIYIYCEAMTAEKKATIQFIQFIG